METTITLADLIELWKVVEIGEDTVVKIDKEEKNKRQYKKQYMIKNKIVEALAQIQIQVLTKVLLRISFVGEKNYKLRK